MSILNSGYGATVNEINDLMTELIWIQFYGYIYGVICNFVICSHSLLE